MQAYFDCFSGVSGDMLVGSLLDAGAPFLALQNLVDSLQIDAAIHSESQMVQNIKSTKFTIIPGAVQPVRHLATILEMIETALVPDRVKKIAQKIFKHLAAAEASVHGVPVEQIHFHETGAVDTIIDVMATLICLYELGITEVASSPLPWGSGFITTAHGRYPLPAPATALLLKDVAVYGSSCNQELVTPTGAAILTALCQSFGPIQASTPRAIGYGAGGLTRLDGVPNLLRVIVSDDSCSIPASERIGVIETQIDDMNPEFVSHLFELIQNDSGVLDLFTTPVYMKRNRPGFLITAIVYPRDIERVSALLLLNTTSLGVRARIDNRYFLKRTQISMETPWGNVGVKIAHLPNGEIRTKPEFRDCQRIALNHNILLADVYTVVNDIISSTSFV